MMRVEVQVLPEKRTSKGWVWSSSLVVKKAEIRASVILFVVGRVRAEFSAEEQVFSLKFGF